MPTAVIVSDSYILRGGPHIVFEEAGFTEVIVAATFLEAIEITHKKPVSLMVVQPESNDYATQVVYQINSYSSPRPPILYIKKLGSAHTPTGQNIYVFETHVIIGKNLSKVLDQIFQTTQDLGLWLKWFLNTQTI